MLEPTRETSKAREHEAFTIAERRGCGWTTAHLSSRCRLLFEHDLRANAFGVCWLRESRFAPPDQVRGHAFPDQAQAQDRVSNARYGNLTTSGPANRPRLRADQPALPPDHRPLGCSADQNATALDAMGRLNRLGLDAAGIDRLMVVKWHEIKIAVYRTEIGEVGSAT